MSIIQNIKKSENYKISPMASWQHRWQAGASWQVEVCGGKMEMLVAGERRCLWEWETLMLPAMTLGWGVVKVPVTIEVGLVARSLQQQDDGTDGSRVWFGELGFERHARFSWYNIWLAHSYKLFVHCIVTKLEENICYNSALDPWSLFKYWPRGW